MEQEDIYIKLIEDLRDEIAEKDKIIESLQNEISDGLTTPESMRVHIRTMKESLAEIEQKKRELDDCLRELKLMKTKYIKMFEDCLSHM